MNIVSSGTSATKIPKIIEEGQGQSIFSGLDTGTNNSEVGSLVSGGLKGMLTGDSYSPYEQQSQEKLARAAQNLRASVGSSYANKMNQGAANKAMNQADQNIFSSIADTNLNLATEKQAMKERGITAALDVSKAQEAKRMDDIKTGMQAEAAYGYIDSFGNLVRGVNANSDKQVDIQEKQVEAGINIDKAKLAESARQFNITTDQAQKQFDAMLTKDYAQLSQQERQFLSSLGLDQAKFEEAKLQNVNQNQLAWAQLKSSEQIALKQIGVDESKLAETARQFNISTDTAISQFKDTMRYNYDQLSQTDKQFLQSLGMDQAKFEYQKEFDKNSLQFNYDQLNSNSKLAYDKMASDEKQFYAGLNSNEKMAYEQMNSNERIAYQENQTRLLDINTNAALTREGILSNQYIAGQNNLNDLTIAGMKISADQNLAKMQIDSAEKLAANSNYLTQQGINLQEAALKGFTDKNGNYVMGSQEIASKELGLKSTEIDLMKKELLGDPETGLQGKLSLMNEEQQLKAKELIGYDKTLPDGSTVHVNGSLESQQAQIDIQKAGLDLDKDRFTDSQVRDNYSIALAAGDYAGANRIASEAGIPSIDYTKPMEREALSKANEAMDSAKQMLDSLGEFATPEQISLFAEKYATAWMEKEKLLGVPFDAKQLDDIVKSYETNGNADNKALNTYVSSTVLDWWSNGEGMMYSGELTGKYADIQKAMATGKNADGTDMTDAQIEDAAAQMGQLVWARYAASTGKFLTANQINMLTSSGILSDEERKALPQSAIAEKDAADQLKDDMKNVSTKLETNNVEVGKIVGENNKPILSNSEISTIVESESTLAPSKKSYTAVFNPSSMTSIDQLKNWASQQKGKIAVSSDNKKSYVITNVSDSAISLYDPATGLTTNVDITMPSVVGLPQQEIVNSRYQTNYTQRDNEAAIKQTDAYKQLVTDKTASIMSQLNSLFTA